jgi:hypothetical protein
MVNRLQKMKRVVVKVEEGDARLPRVTSNGGLALVQALAQRIGLWSRVERDFPRRKDPTQGFTMSAAVCALVHGLLSGGCGFSATEPMRGDEPLLAMLGLERAPSAETIEEVVKSVADKPDGVQKTNHVVSDCSTQLINRTPLKDMVRCEGFVPFWNDGSLLEVGGKKFDAIKVKEGQRGQMCVGAFCGPYATAMDFAEKGEGELTVGRRLIDEAVARVLRPLGLMDKILVLLDSLYGNGPTLTQLEKYREGIPYIVGVMALKEAGRVMAELPEVCWRDTGAQPARGWEESAVAIAWLQCEDWPVKRSMVCRRWRNTGEMIWNYAAVTTNLTSDDPRIVKAMADGRNFAQVIWSLYSYKQAMENQWKDLLRDMSLHHPPCAKARVNAVFYSIAALAYNLAVGVRRLGLAGACSTMTLWRLRRDFFQLAAYASRHAGVVVMRLLDAREWLTKTLLESMERLAQL